VVESKQVVKKMLRNGFTDLNLAETPKIAVARLIELWRTQLDKRPGKGMYPIVLIKVEGRTKEFRPKGSFGYVRCGKGWYVQTLGLIRRFESYLLEQLSLLDYNENLTIFTGLSNTRIPRELSAPVPGVMIHEPDFTVNALHRESVKTPGLNPLAYFTGLETHYFLTRLEHYVGTSIDSVQDKVLFVNYGMYVDAFRKFSKDRLEDGSNDYTKFEEPSNGPGTRTAQMPAYHLKKEDGSGITLINIGVGPSNAWSIMRYLAPLRPHAVMMVGHAAGLRESQKIGDFVMADGYFRRDGITNHHIPYCVPVPPIGEFNTLIRKAMCEILKISDGELWNILETGTAANVASRTWEEFADQVNEVLQSFSLSVDMESGVIAAAGMKWAIPYATLLRISDKPLLGRLKTRKTSNSFYEDVIEPHMSIAMRSMEMLGEIGTKFHSRKIRPWDGPAFR